MPVSVKETIKTTAKNDAFKKVLNMARQCFGTDFSRKQKAPWIYITKQNIKVEIYIVGHISHMGHTAYSVSSLSFL